MARNYSSNNIFEQKHAVQIHRSALKDLKIERLLTSGIGIMEG